VADRKEQILKWLERIKRSSLAAPAFFAQHTVPFSLTQFYRYRKAFEDAGIDGLEDGRSQGNHRRIHSEAEGFLVGYVSAHPEATQVELREVIHERFAIEVSQPGLSQCLGRLGIRTDRGARGVAKPDTWAVQYAGFELVVALAWHFKWPQWTAEVIREVIPRARRSNRFAPEDPPDLKGRSQRGQFTARYNRRRDVRVDKFQSIDIKRSSRSLERMQIVEIDEQTLARKCLAVLTLPFITHNGEVRTVDTAPGRSLKDFCGFHYSQATLSKFLSELKYLGVSGDLLRRQVGFWQEVWRDEIPLEENLPLLCYYVDGNTKALWSTKRVKKHKVTMLGRVMGCLEQVFVHDSHGHPIYFETYSGHAPLGEHVLGLFEKIEDSLEGPGPKLPVNRAIVMDAASNSVRTLRAFAAQKKYHYITSLDDNQWDLRKVRKEGRPQRYRFGEATLWDCEIELEDSNEKGYLFVTRAIKIEWDNGKETYLITSLLKEIIGASQVVKAYFDRWPDEELSFKIMKAIGSLHRVAGYGKQRLPDLRVQERQVKLAGQIEALHRSLHEPMAAIAEAELEISNLIPKERRLRARSQVVDGKRILPSSEAKQFHEIGRQIHALKRTISAIRKEHPDFRKLDRAEQKWIRLQGKETVYKVDVELDQIMTFFRISLVNLYTRMARLMGWSHLTLVKFLHTVLLLSGRVEESPETRHVILERNAKDPTTMAALSTAIAKVNALRIRNAAGQEMSFALNHNHLKQC
jgi:arginine repressor